MRSRGVASGPAAAYQMHMRISTSLAYLVILLPAIAGADSKSAALPKLAKPAPTSTARTLEASDVTASIKPLNDDINHCYLAAAGT